MEKVKILMVLATFVLEYDAHSLECTRCRCCYADGCNSTSQTCITGCKDGYFGRRCWIKCPSHCASCGREFTLKAHPTYNICYKCTDGYYNNGTGVTNCSTPCPINCYKCSSAANCSECKTGFYEMKGRCAATTACPEAPVTDLEKEILSYTGTAVGGMTFSAALMAMCLCIKRRIRKKRKQTNGQKPDTVGSMNTVTSSVSFVGLHNYEQLNTNDGVTEHRYDIPIVKPVKHNYENAKVN